MISAFQNPGNYFYNFWQHNLIQNMLLKSKSRLPKKKLLYLFQWKSLKNDENAFYFIIKALFIPKIFKFLSWRFGHIESKQLEQKDKVNPRIYDVITWITYNYFSEKGLGIVSPPHFVYNFSINFFLMLHSINWPKPGYLYFLRYWTICVL